MFGTRRAPKGCNFVHNDQIWKDHVYRELLNARKLPYKWGFLGEMYMKANGHSVESVCTEKAISSKQSEKKMKLLSIGSVPSKLNGPIGSVTCKSNRPIGSVPCKLNRPIGLVPNKSNRPMESVPNKLTQPVPCKLNQQNISSRPEGLYPLANSEMAGWRCKANLECYGRHARGKIGIEKLLKQPKLSILHRITY